MWLYLLTVWDWLLPKLQILLNLLEGRKREPSYMGSMKSWLTARY